MAGLRRNTHSAPRKPRSEEEHCRVPGLGWAQPEPSRSTRQYGWKPGSIQPSDLASPVLATKTEWSAGPARGFPGPRSLCDCTQDSRPKSSRVQEHRATKPPLWCTAWGIAPTLGVWFRGFARDILWAGLPGRWVSLPPSDQEGIKRKEPAPSLQSADVEALGFNTSLPARN